MFQKGIPLIYQACFFQFFSDHFASDLYTLISQIKIDQEFFSMLVQTFEGLRKRKTLKPEIFRSFSDVVFRASCDNKQLLDLLDDLWGYRKHDTLKEGAIDLISAILSRIPDKDRTKKIF